MKTTYAQRGWMLCALAAIGASAMAQKTMKFHDDWLFLSKHTDAVQLKLGKASVIVVPGYQCRVMTSSADSAKGNGNGWINYDLIKSGKVQAHIMPYGGEDRFWLGPEGGQFAIFFKKGDKFDLDHWQTPKLIDTEKFGVVKKSASSITCSKKATVTNMSGTKFNLAIERTVKMLGASAAKSALGVSVGGDVQMVAYETDNKVTNTGSKAWTESGGLLSIWILGMFKHAPRTTVIAPFNQGDEADLGPIVNDAYFGKVPGDRLVVTDSHVLFKGDGQYRSKIGLSPKRAKPVIGSYDPDSKTLTIIQFTLTPGETKYVNSMWQLQENPFGGDTSNSYNDGPPGPGKKPLGPFYELESSSHAMALKPGKTGRHVSRTFHFNGSLDSLNKISQAVLGYDLEQIESGSAWRQ